MQKPPHIAIAGAGIAGLAASLALAKRGFNLTLLEQAPAFKPLGAGIQLAANALDVLNELEVSGLQEKGVLIASTEVRNGVSGQTLANIPTPAGRPTLVMARSDLHGCLLEAAKAEPNIILHKNAPVKAGQIREKEQSIELTYGAGQSLHCDMLIGADGLCSSVRALVNDAKPKLTGHIAWRAVLPINAAPEGMPRHTLTLWLGPKAHVVTYPIKAGAALNAVIITKGKWRKQGWMAKGSRAELQSSLKGWQPPLQALIQAATWDKWALAAIDPTAPWTKGRIALIGDAAHAMTPFLAQGAAMGLEDAALFAKMLKNASGPNIPKTFLAYEAARKPRVVRLWHRAAQQGKIYHLGGPMGLARNSFMRLAGGERLARSIEWIYTPPE